MSRSALYVGHVVHTRLRPTRHHLKYACYWLYVDLAELPELSKTLRWFSYNRRGIFSIYDADYPLGAGATLQQRVVSVLAANGIDGSGLSIRLLTMPRVLGFTFNPISIFYCYGRDGALRAVIYDVHNTFRQQHSYVVAVSGETVPHLTHECAKRFYVSPFLEMNLGYRFDVVEPAAKVRLAVSASDKSGPLLLASLAGDRAPLSDLALLRVFATHPLLTLKVVGAIHWEALRLWLKGVRLVPRPAPPETPTTTIRPTTKHLEST